MLVELRPSLPGQGDLVNLAELNRLLRILCQEIDEVAGAVTERIEIIREVYEDPDSDLHFVFD